MKIQLKRSDVLESGNAKEPSAEVMEFGELAVNYNAADPSIFIKDSNSNIIEIASKDSSLNGNLWNNTGNFLYPTNSESFVGIGTQVPNERLTVEGNIQLNNASGYSFINYGSNSTDAWKNWHVGSEGDGYFNFYNGVTGSGPKRMTISSNGNVGIGKDTPSSALDVAGAGKFTQKVTTAETQSSDGDATVTTKGYVDNLISGTVTGAALWTQDGSKLYPKTISSNVGIGQQNPVEKLDVNGNIKVSGTAAITGKATSAATVSGDGNTTLTTKSYVDAQDSALKSDLENQINNGVSGGTFWRLNGNDLSPKSTSYQLGVGKSNPSESLDVIGNGKFSGTVTTQATTTNSGSTIVTTKGYVDSQISTSAGAILTTVGEQISNATFWTLYGSNLYPENTGYNVGIGNTNPSSKLEVSGDIKCTKVLVTATTPSANNELTSKSYVDGKVNGIDFWRRASGKVYLETNTDNVGIGIDSPEYKLEVIGDIKADNFRIDKLPVLP